MTKKDFELLANILGSIEFVKTSEMTQITNTLARTYPSFNKDKFAKAYLERANSKRWDDDISPKERFVFPDNAPLSEYASNNQLRIALSQALDASAAERAEAEARLELMEYFR